MARQKLESWEDFQSDHPPTVKLSELPSCLDHFAAFKNDPEHFGMIISMRDLGGCLLLRLRCPECLLPFHVKVQRSL